MTTVTGQLQSLARPAKLPFKRRVRIPNLPIAYVCISEPDGPHTATAIYSLRETISTATPKFQLLLQASQW